MISKKRAWVQPVPAGPTLSFFDSGQTLSWRFAPVHLGLQAGARLLHADVAGRQVFERVLVEQGGVADQGDDVGHGLGGDDGIRRQRLYIAEVHLPWRGAA